MVSLRSKPRARLAVPSDAAQLLTSAVEEASPGTDLGRVSLPPGEPIVAGDCGLSGEAVELSGADLQPGAAPVALGRSRTSSLPVVASYQQLVVPGRQRLLVVLGDCGCDFEAVKLPGGGDQPRAAALSDGGVADEFLSCGGMVPAGDCSRTREVGWICDHRACLCNREDATGGDLETS